MNASKLIMTKLKAILKFVLIATAAIAGLIYLNNQNFETRMLLGIYALIVYLAYFANQRIEQLAKDKFYQCTFEKQIIAVDSEDAVADFEIKSKLPFPPFIGLEVVSCLNPIPEDSEDYDNHDFQAFYSGKITGVVWRYSKFVCRVEPHKMTAQNKLEEVIINHYQYAWELDGLYFEEKKRVLDYIEHELSKLEDAADEKADRRYGRLEIAKKKLQR